MKPSFTLLAAIVAALSGGCTAAPASPGGRLTLTLVDDALAPPVTRREAALSPAPSATPTTVTIELR